LLSLEFGHGDMGAGAAERLRHYREFVYERCCEKTLTYGRGNLWSYERGEGRYKHC
jgi:hypothetical protein